ncbi:MAG: 30S ribosomal protein S8 [Deltaproteobacteria bacterium]|nr:30S ribosomal protein S8 [Deltaproteobacteria bacterium]
MMTDPMGDMLTRIRNASRVRHGETRCPASKLKLAVAQVLTKEGFLEGVSTEEQGKKSELVMALRYDDFGKSMIDSIQRVSKPGRRIYVGAAEVASVRNGLGMSILSTSKGVMCDRDARAEKVGGEVICEVW